MRETDGTFSKGNPGGPGRPRRAIERQYLAELSSTVTLEKWGTIVSRAVDDAAKGDARARDWLSRYILGQPRGREPLFDLAKRERAGKSVESLVDESHYQDEFYVGWKIDVPEDGDSK